MKREKITKQTNGRLRFAHLGDNITEINTEHFFEFYDSGGTWFFLYAPRLESKEKTNYVQQQRNSGALLRPYLTLFGVAGNCSPDFVPL